MSNPDRNAVEPVHIGGRPVGAGEQTLVVAEAGVNHNGSVECALGLIDAAVEAGADAVKFQVFRAETLTTASAETTRDQARACGDQTQRAMLSRLELSHDDLLRIKRHCDASGVLMIATPFDAQAVRSLADLGVAAIKIASTDLVHTPLLEVAAETGLPMIASTGASTEPEILDAIAALRRIGAGDRLVLLHCVSCYPTPIEAINLRAMGRLALASGLPVGLSDHTLSIHTGGWAVAAGACVIEKHFTLDRSAEGPDHAMSLNPRELSEYVVLTRDAERALGTGDPGMTALETEVRTLARRSIVAAVDIQAGQCLAPGMLTLKRPGIGLGADMLKRLIGRRAAVHIARDSLFTWDMVQ